MKLKPTTSNSTEVLMFRNSELWDFVHRYETLSCENS